VRCADPPAADLALGAGDGTLAQLKRFGLAITGDPLLELKREGNLSDVRNRGYVGSRDAVSVLIEGWRDWNTAI